MKHQGPLGMPRLMGIGPLASLQVPDTIEIDLNGREIDQIRTDNENLDFEVVNNHFEGHFIGVDIYASITDGSEIHSSMTIDPYKNGMVTGRGNRAHLFHLKVPKQMRGKGMGTTLMNVYKTYVRQAGYFRVSGRIGNHGTADFMQKNGINTDYLHVVSVPGDVERSVVIGTKQDAQRAEDMPPAEAAEAMEGVPVDEAFGR